MHAVAEGPYVAAGQEVRARLALALGRLAYALFYLGVAALVLGVPVGLGWLVWRWLAG